MPNPLNDLVPENPLNAYLEADPLFFTEHVGQEIRATPDSKWLDILDFVSGVENKDHTLLDKVGSDAASFVAGATATVLKKTKLGIQPDTSDYLFSGLEVGLPALGNIAKLMSRGGGIIAGGVSKKQRGIIGSERFNKYGDVGGWPTRNTFYSEIANDTPDKVTNLNTVLVYQSQGKSAEEIYKKTGWWFDDANKLWRFEIDDNKAVFSDIGRDRILKTAKGYFGNQEAVLPLSEVLPHPELYKTYPFLKYVVIKLKNVPDSLNRGSWNEMQQELILNVGAYGKFGSTNDDYILERLRGTVLHEIQHAVQSYDNLLNGGNVDSILAKGTSQNLSKQDAFDIYKRLFGEAEARVVTYRASSDKTIRYLERQISRKLDQIAKLGRARNNSQFTEEIDKQLEIEILNLKAARDELEVLKNANPHENIPFMRERPVNKEDLIPKSGKTLSPDDIEKTKKGMGMPSDEGSAVPAPVLAAGTVAAAGGMVSANFADMSKEEKLKHFQTFAELTQVEDGMYQGPDNKIYEIRDGKVTEWQP